MKLFNKKVNLLLGIDINEMELQNSKECLQPISLDYIMKPEHPVEAYLICGDISSPPTELINVLNEGSLDFVSLVEVIEHMYSDCLDKTVDVVFGKLKPKVVAITTPNSEFNVVFENNTEPSSPKDIKKFRHFDHKFEWTRKEFEEWCLNVLEKYKDSYEKCLFDGVGEPPIGFEHVGKCSQIAVFIMKDLNEDPDGATNESGLKSYLNKLYYTPYPNNLVPIITKEMLKDTNYNLIETVRCPYELKLDSNNTQRIIHEINWLITFLTRPFKIDNSTDYESNFSEEEKKELIENDIEYNYEDYKLISIEHLLQFSTIKKFQLTETTIKNLLALENKYIISKSGKYIIYKVPDYDSYHKNSFDLDHDNDDEDKISNITIFNYNQDENWSNECYELQFEDKLDDESAKSTLNDNSQSNFRYKINLNALENPNNYYYEEAKLFDEKMKSIRRHNRSEFKKKSEEVSEEQFEDL